MTPVLWRFVLLLLVFISTAIWPVARWTLSKGGHVPAMGFSTSLVTFLCAAIGLLFVGPAESLNELWLPGILLGFAYSIGFIVLMMRSLQVGPSGPTATINNAAMICGVLYGLLWLEPRVPSWSALIGIAGVLLGLLSIGYGTWRGGRVDPRWFPLVSGGGALSGLSFMTQTFVGLRNPEVSGLLTYLTIGFLTSALFLIPFLPPLNRLIRMRRELIGGAIIGLANSLNLPLMLGAIHHLGEEIVLPVAVVTPMVLVMILGHFVYGERLTRTTWAGCLLVAGAVGLLVSGT
ncbi:MAG: DMT family transporter [Candidatus Omnitrophica bacterium]|nr:DMT family transporter [Candidatus Omnitrophota bacterium]